MLIQLLVRSVAPEKSLGRADVDEQLLLIKQTFRITPILRDGDLFTGGKNNENNGV